MHLGNDNGQDPEEREQELPPYGTQRREFDAEGPETATNNGGNYASNANPKERIVHGKSPLTVTSRLVCDCPSLSTFNNGNMISSYFGIGIGLLLL
jgi:hypothetical protein